MGRGKGVREEKSSATYPPVDAELEFAVVMHSTLFQSVMSEALDTG